MCRSRACARIVYDMQVCGHVIQDAYTGGWCEHHLATAEATCPCVGPRAGSCARRRAAVAYAVVCGVPPRAQALHAPCARWAPIDTWWLCYALVFRGAAAVHERVAALALVASSALPPAEHSWVVPQMVHAALNKGGLPLATALCTCFAGGAVHHLVPAALNADVRVSAPAFARVVRDVLATRCDRWDKWRSILWRCEQPCSAAAGAAALRGAHGAASRWELNTLKHAWVSTAARRVPVAGH